MAWRATILAAITLAVLAMPAAAQLQGDAVQVHGFAGWGYGKTDGNSYQLGTEDGSYDNVNFSLNLNATLSDRLMIAAQVEWHMENDSTETDLDYVFAQWKFSNALFLRIGQVQQPFGIYTEIYDVGTLRPFLRLPQGVYGPSSLIAESYLGAGVTGEYFTSSNWSIAYDAYVGELKTPFYHWIMNFDWQTGAPIDRSSTFDYTDVFGARVVVGTPLTGLAFGASYYSGVPTGLENDPDASSGFVMSGRRDILGLQGEFNNDTWWIRGEWVSVVNGSTSVDGAEITGDTGYAEIAFKATEHWQLAARYDYQTNNFGAGFDYGPEFSSLNDHKDIGFAVNYWFSPNLVIKTEYHRVEGNRFADPGWDNFWEIVYGINDQTDLFQIGAQFSF